MDFKALQPLQMDWDRNAGESLFGDFLVPRFLSSRDVFVQTRCCGIHLCRSFVTRHIFLLVENSISFQGPLNIGLKDCEKSRRAINLVHVLKREIISM